MYEREVITGLVAERLARRIMAAPSELQAIADDVMALFDVHRERFGPGPADSFVVLTLAPAARTGLTDVEL